ncbi:hypothetical protein EG68_03691 [Paragonimus skrjabini miyazakii]|uniref:Uncharacterized protein n=1 Tax=Paragonimus skrjabini miyazakii TaxID=59628 RepID=A0A8S9YX74_9TREM|nr:hypothetical protein EG68_03691 [Paragonimus skrjabini miyazakii]
MRNLTILPCKEMEKKHNYLMKLLPRKIDSLLAEYFVWITEEIADNLVNVQSKFTLALSDYTHLVLASPFASEVSKLGDVTPGCPASEHSRDLSASTPPPSIEFERLSNCNRLSTLLDVKLSIEEASLKCQLKYLTRLFEQDDPGTEILNSQTHSEESLSEDGEKRLKALEVRYSQLARELASFDGLDMRQSRLDSKKAREQKLLDRLNKILDTASYENACIRILTDLVHLESDSCRKIIENSKSIAACVEPYLDRGQKLLSSLSAMYQPRSDSSPDKFCHLVATTHFEHVARKLLSSQNARIPEEFAHLLHSEDPNSIPSLLEALQHKLDRDRQSAETLMQTISQFSIQLINQLDSLRTCFLTSCSPIPYDQSKPHGDRASADRLLASSAGLCDRQLAESLAAPCAILNRLAQQLNALRQQSDLVFSI